jgi:hypothetical protein
MTPFVFDPTSYSPAVSNLLKEPRLPDLGPGSFNVSARAALQAFNPMTDLGHPITDSAAARACHSALWLYHDGLEESHAISQGLEELETKEGSFWHAIMHRREPDAANSKYWWRMVGDHPVIELLKIEAPKIGYDYTVPQDFVDFCEQARGGETPQETLAKRVQLLEWQLLFDYCYRKAIG